MTMPCSWSSSGARNLYPHCVGPFAFIRVKAFSGITETCSQHVQEAGALSRNNPSNISQRRFHPVGQGGLFNMSPSLHSHSVNDKEQHQIKWPLFYEKLRACLQTALYNTGPPAETPPHSTHEPTALLLILAAKPLGDTATTSARALPAPHQAQAAQRRQPGSPSFHQPTFTFICFTCACSWAHQPCAVLLRSWLSPAEQCGSPLPAPAQLGLKALREAKDEGEASASAGVHGKMVLHQSETERWGWQHCLAVPQPQQGQVRAQLRLFVSC